MKKIVLLVSLVLVVTTSCNYNDQELGVSPYQENEQQDKLTHSYEVNRRSGEFTNFAMSGPSQELRGLNSRDFHTSDVQGAREVIQQIGLYEVRDIEVNGNV